MLVTQAQLDKIAQEVNNLKPTKYVAPNKFIPPGFVEDLHEVLQWCQMEDAVHIMKALHLENYKVSNDIGHQYNIEELSAIHSPQTYCKSVGPVWFYAGPEKEIDSQDSRDRFSFISASVLSLVMDCVLFRVSTEGYDVLKQLEIPL